MTISNTKFLIIDLLCLASRFWIIKLFTNKFTTASFHIIFDFIQSGKLEKHFFKQITFIKIF